MQTSNSCSVTMDKTHDQQNAYGSFLVPTWTMKLTTCSEHLHPISDHQSVCIFRSHDTHTTKDVEIRKKKIKIKYDGKKNEKKRLGRNKEEEEKVAFVVSLYSWKPLSYICPFSVYHQTIQKQEKIAPEKSWWSQPNNQLIRRQTSASTTWPPLQACTVYFILTDLWIKQTRTGKSPSLSQLAYRPAGRNCKFLNALFLPCKSNRQIILGTKRFGIQKSVWWWPVHAH